MPHNTTIHLSRLREIHAASRTPCGQVMAALAGLDSNQVLHMTKGLSRSQLRQ